ncbi:hypothetical protein VE02_05924 [Pseudogymnoascus sp. 03VT05]|nr:hypothetical protein VE02_05924 [Pseudogymnoascus sp. 03VT05]
MLRFIYQGDYDDEREQNRAAEDPPHETKIDTERWKDVISDILGRPPQEPGRPHWNGGALRVNIEVFVIADHHHLNALMEHAAKKFEENLAHLWQTPSFAKSINLFYDSQISELYRRPIRNVITKVIVKNAPVLLKKKAFRNVLSRYSDLATEVLWTVVKVEDER